MLLFCQIKEIALIYQIKIKCVSFISENQRNNLDCSLCRLAVPSFMKHIQNLRKDIVNISCFSGIRQDGLLVFIHIFAITTITYVKIIG
ncbi:unknown [Bacteroides sp. CAG:770]|nr:unknown [Bacteroides sp. CAG:770]